MDDIEWFSSARSSFAKTNQMLVKINKGNLCFSKYLVSAINNISPKINFGWYNNILFIRPVIGNDNGNEEIGRKIAISNGGYGQILFASKLKEWFGEKNITGKYLAKFNSEKNWFEVDTKKQI